MQPTPMGVDTDGDGMPDNVDTDDDNDGINDFMADGMTALDPQRLIPDCGGTPTMSPRTQDGSAANPYCIDTLAELQSIGSGFANGYTMANDETHTEAQSLGYHYRLTANIDAWPTNNLGETANPGTRDSEITYADGSSNDSPAAYDSTTYSSGFTPIGPTFTGTFEGGGYTIHGLRVSGSADGNWGLFAEISGNGAMVANLHLREVDIDGQKFVGALAGKLLSSAIVDSVSMSGAVSGTSEANERIGGLLGQNNAATLQNSYAHGNIDGGVGYTDYVGGLVGLNSDSATVRNSYASGNVDGGDGTGDNVGGLVGRNIDSATVRNSYASGNVDGGDGIGDNVGGLVGLSSLATVQNSYATGNVDGGGGGGDQVGGLAGNSSVAIPDSYRNREVMPTGEAINPHGIARTAAQLYYPSGTPTYTTGTTTIVSFEFTTPSTETACNAPLGRR